MYKIVSNRKRLWKRQDDDRSRHTHVQSEECQDQEESQDDEQQPLLTPS